MALFLVTAPAIEPVTVAEAKAQLRQASAAEDALVAARIRAAREYVEIATRRPLIDQTWDWKRDGFPCDSAAMDLPFANVSAVSSITYTDTNGVAQTWSTSLYTTDLPTGPMAQRGRIQPAYGQYYPLTRDVPNAVVIRLVAGYGATGASVPDSIKLAILQMVAHWFEQREPVQVGVGQTVTPVPMMVSAICASMRAW